MPGEESYYVVKFQNNPQGTQDSGERIARYTPGGAHGASGSGSERCRSARRTDRAYRRLGDSNWGAGARPASAGLQFGSRYPGSPAEVVVYDFLPDEQLREVVNLTDFCGMLVFDKWTCNTNGRQAIFSRAKNEARYQAQMIDQGFCFNAGEWNFPDAPLRGLYSRHRVYESVRGLESFEPWLGRVESKMTEAVLDEIQRKYPENGMVSISRRSRKCSNISCGGANLSANC